MRLADAFGQPVRWTQPSLWSQEYELRAGDDVVATLGFRSSLGTLAAGRCGDAAWTFKRVGFWRTRTTVRVEGEGDDLAVFQHDTWDGGGSLTLADGQRIKVTTNTWQTRIEFRREEEPLFRYHTEGFLRQEARLELLPPSMHVKELPWLLLFGWYLVVMMHRDAAATVVIVG